MNDGLHERLKKLLALAQRGVGGESINAQAALDAALRKNGLTINDIMDDARRIYGFSWNGSLERRLLAQIIVTVCGSKVQMFRSRVERQKLLAKMTQQERVEIELLWTVHRTEVKKEMALFYSSYLHRHGLFPRDGKTQPRPNTPEEEHRIKRMALMMMAMCPVVVRKQLPGADQVQP